MTRDNTRHIVLELYDHAGRLIDREIGHTKDSATASVFRWQRRGYRVKIVNLDDQHR